MAYCIFLYNTNFEKASASKLEFTFSKNQSSVATWLLLLSLSYSHWAIWSCQGGLITISFFERFADRALTSVTMLPVSNNLSRSGTVFHRAGVNRLASGHVFKHIFHCVTVRKATLEIAKHLWTDDHVVKSEKIIHLTELALIRHSFQLIFITFPKVDTNCFHI